MKQHLDTIEDAILAIRNGELVIVVDDEDRENEGDFICATEKITPELINYMATHGRGLICTSLTEARCAELDLPLMVSANTTQHETAFTVSVDLNGKGVSTGISAKDRAHTNLALIDKNTVATDLARPGHVFPLKAKDGGVLRRTGHTEASVDLARLAGFAPSGVLVEIMNEDGTMARLPELLVLAEKLGHKIVSIKDLVAYRMQHESLVTQEEDIFMPTKYGEFRLIAFREIQTGDLHLAMVKGSWHADEPVLVRVHSSCETGDILHSLRCDCGDQLHKAMTMVEREGKGVVLYMRQEGRGIGLLNKLHAYKLQEQGLDTVEANLELGFASDERDYGVGAQILHNLGISKMRLMSNNPKKRVGLVGYGLEIVETVAIEVPSNPHNLRYMQTKRDKMGHTILK
jgi:3,4-dihydroxy 2-butanone 4-phosphate synthase / GTP cyclohydrolase II